MVGVFGLDPAKVNQFKEGSMYNPKITQGRALKSNDKYSLIMGKDLAEDYSKTVGSKVYFSGKDWKIVGIFESESRPFSRMVMAPYDMVQEITGRDSDTIGFKIRIDQFPSHGRLPLEPAKSLVNDKYLIDIWYFH